MPSTQASLIESFYKVMCSTTRPNNDSRVEDNDYFKRRIQGFKPENEFSNLIASRGKRFLDGGQFISQKLTGETAEGNSFIYSTISTDAPEDYLSIYKGISAWDKVTNLFFLQLQNDGWTTVPYETKNNARTRNWDTISKPNFRYYIFNRTTESFELSNIQDFSIVLACFMIRPRTQLEPRSVLREREKFNFLATFQLAELQKLYATRYFLGVLASQISDKNIIDLDGFILSNNRITLVEIKEKEPIKAPNDPTNVVKWSYGWDTRRILWYQYILNITKFNFYYVVRRIGNRTIRDLEAWDCITIEEFLKNISWSNSTSGGGAESTLTAPYSAFKNFLLEDV